MGASDGVTVMAGNEAGKLTFLHYFPESKRQ